MGSFKVIAKFGEVIHKNIKKLDLFSQKIMLTYEGESSFSTFLGGLVSIIILVGVGVYSAFLLHIMYNKQDANNTKSTEVLDLTVHDKNYYPVRFVKFLLTT